MSKKKATVDRRQKTMLVSILIILLLIVFLAGYTFAKYYSLYEIDGSAEIAKWSFKVNGNSQYQVEEITLSNTALEDGKIAPGSKGSFDLVLDATGSEVDVKYEVIATEDGNKPTNLFFKLAEDGIERETEYSTLAELAEAELTGTIKVDDDDQDKVKNYTIIWEWPYGSEVNEDIQEFQRDEADKLAGQGIVYDEEGNETSDVFDYEFSLMITGSQVKTTANG